MSAETGHDRTCLSGVQVRPLTRVRAGEYKSADARWTFLSGKAAGYDGANYYCWHIWEAGFDDAWGTREVTLREAVAAVQMELDLEAKWKADLAVAE